MHLGNIYKGLVSFICVRCALGIEYTFKDDSSMNANTNENTNANTNANTSANTNVRALIRSSGPTKSIDKLRRVKKTTETKKKKKKQI
jgi:hypothetical protein